MYFLVAVSMLRGGQDHDQRANGRFAVLQNVKYPSKRNPLDVMYPVTTPVTSLGLSPLIFELENGHGAVYTWTRTD